MAKGVLFPKLLPELDVYNYRGCLPFTGTISPKYGAAWQCPCAQSKLNEEIVCQSLK